MYVYINDGIVPASDAKISVFDHGFLYGDGVYETMRAYDGVVFMIEEHIKRLFRSASMIRLDIARDAGSVRTAIYRTLSANSLKSAYMRLTVSRGYGPVGLDPELCKKPTFIIIAEEFREYPETYYENGIRVIIAETRRNLTTAINPQIKSLNFLNNILAKVEAKEKGAYEAFMLNASGHLTEGTISNLFFVKDDILCTPSVECGILDGITRAIVIDLAARNGITVREGRFTQDELYRASEVFITNTTAEVMSACRVDNVDFMIGDVSGLLLKEYRKEVDAYVKEKRGESPSLRE